MRQPILRLAALSGLVSWATKPGVSPCITLGNISRRAWLLLHEAFPRPGGRTAACTMGTATPSAPAISCIFKPSDWPSRTRAFSCTSRRYSFGSAAGCGGMIDVSTPVRRSLNSAYEVYSIRSSPRRSAGASPVACRPSGTGRTRSTTRNTRPAGDRRRRRAQRSEHSPARQGGTLHQRQAEAAAELGGLDLDDTGASAAPRPRSAQPATSWKALTGGRTSTPGRAAPSRGDVPGHRAVVRNARRPAAC